MTAPRRAGGVYTLGEYRVPRRAFGQTSPGPCRECGAAPGLPCAGNGGELHDGRWILDLLLRREQAAS